MSSLIDWSPLPCMVPAEQDGDADRILWPEMSRTVLDEWQGAELHYLSPREVCEKFGYPGPGARADVTEAEQQHFENMLERSPRQDGDVTVAPAPVDRVEASREIKALASSLGADLVGITPVNPHYVYAGQDVPHANAIVCALAMRMDELLRVPRLEANAEFLRAYDELSAIGVELACQIRERGYPARAHTLLSEGLAMLPHAHAAGIGELGKHGSLINRELGSCFRVSVVTTDLPLSADQPRDDGIEQFCANCQMCTTHCPGDAISDERSEVRGTTKWVVDTEACVPYFAQHYACGICLQVCPFNAKAFDGVFKSDFTAAVANIDSEAVARRLTDSLDAPWTELAPRDAAAD
ncbi:MAG: 4Fe-4S dicluster domain-containing protein [Gaiellaceae bacterium]